jgi:mersacidin/lichenicidin family type 2 lantibiotic
MSDKLQNPFGLDIERFWKDDEYKKELFENQIGKYPQNPAGDVQEISDAELDSVTGAATGCSFTAGCCHLPTCFGLTQCGSICVTNGWSLVNCC